MRGVKRAGGHRGPSSFYSQISQGRVDGVDGVDGVDEVDGVFIELMGLRNAQIELEITGSQGGKM